MKVLVVGSGGREHALVWALRRSPSVTEVFSAPGNAGIAQEADIVPISASAIIELADFAESARVDLTVVGPEVPLSLGIVDEFQKRELPIFGPTRNAAEIEISKIYSKELCRRCHIPAPAALVCASRAEAEKALAETGLPAVLKADGLAAGKGVVILTTPAEVKKALTLFFEERVFGRAGERVLVEEFLEGDEASMLALCDGHTAIPLPTAKDYKKAYDGDRGPNTGGMGAHSPAGILDAETATEVMKKIIRPALAGLAAERREFRGVLYAGIMVTKDGPKVLEFNARFGDPEAEVILPRLSSDLAKALSAAARGDLAGTELSWKNEACAGVVLASAGYPGSSVPGHAITRVEEAAKIPGVKIFHSATQRQADKLVTAGGRVFVVTGSGANIAEAAAAAYRAAESISFEGKQYRRDIGSHFLSMDSTMSRKRQSGRTSLT